MPTSITLTGWKEFADKCNSLPDELLREVEGEVEYAAENWAGLAKDAAPKDLGHLIGGIDAYHVGNGISEVVSKAEYSSFIEWGTKSYKQVPADLQGYADSLVYNKSGDYYDFLNAILDWVKRKGLASITNSYTGRKSTKKDDLILVAQTIAFFIMKYGIHPHPFFFIQMPIVEEQLKANVQKILNTEH